MTRPNFAFVNNDLLPIADAKVSVLDRGLLFADGVYEVVAVIAGRLVDFEPHFERLRRSLGELQIPFDVDEMSLRDMMQRLVDKESLDEGMVYVQATRGAPPTRAFSYSCEQTTPTLIMFVQDVSMRENPLVQCGAAVVTVPDLRWKRRDIKSTSLLPQVMGKQIAKEADAFEAWMVEDGFVTEGASSSAGIITDDDRLISRHISNEVLDSVTRRAVFRMAEEMGLTIEQRRFTVDEAYAAAEAFSASATALIMPVVKIDCRTIGNGRPGPYTLRLRELYLQEAIS